MGLEKTVTLVDSFGESVTFEKAYFRIDAIQGGKNSMTAFVSCNKKTNDGFRVLETRSHDFTPSLSGVNFIAQAYEHLKTLPEFAGAVDC